MKYAGIGSRETPKGVLEIMQDMSLILHERDWVLRSGGAKGADYAFASQTNKKEIFIPWEGYNGLFSNDNGIINPHNSPDYKEAQKVAEHFHPAWDKCSKAARLFHTRNVMIISGIALNDPVNIVICWTPRGQITGGTGHALRVAEYLKIPVLNLSKTTINELLDWLYKEGI